MIGMLYIVVQKVSIHKKQKIEDSHNIAHQP
ncbi:hypothetical protein PAQU9191_00588 [Photobacterium aquimaris]|uniref:Uncharacterized protein n=1 Tax=Photobacterium aquimaris TaxID=512643 RepID=A0A1Y6KW22_9GAMM|nr:hypothetical protein PAQU9191_00588 [Photobacterium aquimaris]